MSEEPDGDALPEPAELRRELDALRAAMGPDPFQAGREWARRNGADSLLRLGVGQILKLADESLRLTDRKGVDRDSPRGQQIANEMQAAPFLPPDWRTVLASVALGWEARLSDVIAYRRLLEGMVAGAEELSGSVERG